MLADSTVTAMIAVNNLQKGKEFYGETLGLRHVHENPGGVSYVCGAGRVFVYESPTAGKNEATSATWEVSDIEAVVAELKQKGITFEKYDVSGAQWEGEVLVMDDMKAAWFKDPDGNILGLSQDSSVAE